MTVDDYVMQTLMRDLVGHDRSPAAFLVYLHLTAESARTDMREIERSYQEIANSTGLSKSAVQGGVRRLLLRRLIAQSKPSPTAKPRYKVLRPWQRRR
jgi:hypothetical protein